MKIENGLFKQIQQKAESIFNTPFPTYKYGSIIFGCNVKSPIDNGYTSMSAVGTNTWRGFHRTPNSLYGSKDVFTSYFKEQEIFIIDSLKTIKTVEELDHFENKIYLDIRNRLQGNIRSDMLTSYNKIRKPIDLYIEHIVAMANELADTRSQLNQLLFLPLDSQIFSSPYIFSREQLYSLGINDNATFKDVRTSKVYITLQNTAFQKAHDISNAIGKTFDRIHFDLLWNDRYKKEGNNLFETNF